MDTTKSNEIKRLVISDIFIYNGPYDYHARKQVWAYLEAGHQWRLVDDKLSESYAFISRLCSKRAIEVENGHILCAGRKIRSEDYLGLWRASAKNPLSCAKLTERGGHIAATIKRQRIPFEKYVSQWCPDKLELLKRNDCTVDEHTATWTFKLENLDSCQLFDQLTSVYCQEQEQPGQSSVSVALFLPDAFISAEPEEQLSCVEQVRSQYVLEM